MDLYVTDKSRGEMNFEKIMWKPSGKVGAETTLLNMYIIAINY